LTPEDIDHLTDLIGDTDVMRWWPTRFDRDGARKWIEKQLGRYETDGCGYWLAFEAQTNKPIGQAGVILNEVCGRRQPALGWIVAKAHWSQGFATELGRGCIDWAFANRSDDTLTAPIQPGNIESEAVARKLSMRVTAQDVMSGLPHDIWTVTRGGWDRLS
jgi:ribosomal-protein-alanine N-acetyltransferase